MLLFSIFRSNLSNIYLGDMCMWNERLRELREEHDLTQSQLAHKLGLNYKTIYRYENGICEPNLSILVKLAKMYDVSIDYLCNLSDIKKRDNDALIEMLSKNINETNNLLKALKKSR